MPVHEFYCGNCNEVYDRFFHTVQAAEEFKTGKKECPKCNDTLENVISGFNAGRSKKAVPTKMTESGSHEIKDIPIMTVCDGVVDPKKGEYKCKRIRTLSLKEIKENSGNN